MAKKNTHAHAAVLTPAQQLAALKLKFARLNQIRHQLAANKALYVEHDTIVRDLLPLFLTEEDDRWILQKRITIGNTVHTITPSFYDPKDASIKVKRWKATALESFTIE